MVVEADPGVLSRTDMQLGVHHSFLDHSTSVREAAVDLVGKFVLSRPEVLNTYYDMISARILVIVLTFCVCVCVCLPTIALIYCCTEWV